MPLSDEQKEWVYNEVNTQINSRLLSIRIRFYGVVLALIVGGTLGLYYVTQFSDQNRELIEAQQEQSKRSAEDAYDRCVQGNKSRAGTRETFHDLVDIATRPDPSMPPPTPEQQARVREFKNNVNQAIKANIPNVSCEGLKQGAQ